MLCSVRVLLVLVLSEADVDSRWVHDDKGRLSLEHLGMRFMVLMMLKAHELNHHYQQREWTYKTTNGGEGVLSREVYRRLSD